MVKQFGFLLFLLIHTVLAAIILAASRIIFGPGLTLRSDIGGSVILASFLLLITSLLRPSMFSLFLGHRATRPRLSVWLIFVGVVTLVLLISSELGRNTLYGATFYNGPRPEPTNITFVNPAGESVTSLAYPGQVVFMVASDTYLSGVRNLVKSWNGKIIGQIPDLRFYLIEVPHGEEGEFIAKAHENSQVLHVSPNLVLEAGEAPPVDLSEKGEDPHGMVPALISGTMLGQKVIMAQLDNFLTSSHGEDVRKTGEGITGSQDSLRIHIGGLPCGRLLPALCSSSDQSLNGLAAIIAGAELNKQKVTVNLSWGPVPPQTSDEKQFSSTGVAGANAWALPTFEAYYEQLFSVLNSSEWARTGNVLLNKSAGNGVSLNKNGERAGISGVDLGVALDRLQKKFPDTIGKSMVFCGALAADGSRAAYSNFGQGVIYAVVPADKPGTSFAAPQCWGASYNAWKEHPELSAGELAKAMYDSAKPNAQGFGVLDPAGVRSAGAVPEVPQPIEEAAPEPAAPAATGPSCNGKVWTVCPSGYKFYCPPSSGDPSCNPKDSILCNGKWYPPCDSGYDWSCASSGGQCTPTETNEGIEEETPPLPPPNTVCELNACYDECHTAWPPCRQECDEKWSSYGIQAHADCYNRCQVTHQYCLDACTGRWPPCS